MASLQSYLLEFWIRRLNLFSGKQVDPLSLRLRIERMARKARLPSGVRLLPGEAASLHSEWLIPPDAPQDRALLYLHGGAWFMGSTLTHRTFVARLALASGIRALSINYRLAPEDPFPAGLEDCLAAYTWLLESGIAAEKVVVAGDSAGGNLTLALLIALRDTGKPLPAGAVAISPATNLDFSGASYAARRRRDPFFSHMGSNRIIQDYVADQDPRHPWISPLYANLSGLPPLLIHVGEHEMLLEDVVQFGQRAAASGVEVQTVVWPGMFHVFQMFGPLLPEARQANAQISAFIQRRLEAD